MKLINKGSHVQVVFNGRIDSGVVLGYFYDSINELMYIVRLLDDSEIILDYTCVKEK